MKKKVTLLLIASSMVLSGCSWKDLMFWKKWGKKNNEPEQQEPERKTITGILEVQAPKLIEQGQTLESVQVKVKYSDESTAVIPSTRVELDTSTVGTVTGTAYVGELSKTFTIEVYSSSIRTHHGTFTSVGGSDTAGNGYSDVTLVSPDDSINLRAEKVSFDGTKLTANKNSYIVIYNKVDSPLNDVASLECNWTYTDNLDYENIIGTLYFSYNFLSLEDIFSGYYSDLQTFGGSLETHGTTGSISTSSLGVSAPNARYFLFILQTPSEDLSLTSISVVSESETAPEAVDKGSYSYPTGFGEKFLGFTNGFPFIGNGSFMFTDSGTDELFMFQPIGKFDWLISQFLANDFVYATEMMGLSVYQKPINETQAYTYAFQTIDFEGFDVFNVSSVGLYDILIENNAWPEEEINGAINDAGFKALITQPTFTGQVSYVLHIDQSEGENEVGLLINNKDGSVEQANANANVLKDYAMSFVTNHSFVVSSEFGEIEGESYLYSLTVKSSDLRFAVEVTAIYSDDYKALTLTFVETIFGEFPTTSLRAFFEDNNFPVLSSALGQFAPKTNDSGSEMNITTVGVTHEELLTYITALTSYGFSHSDYGSDTSHTYYGSKTVITASGAFTLSYSITEYANYMTIRFSKSTASLESSLSYALNKLFSSSSTKDLLTSYANEVDQSVRSGGFLADTTNKIVYCMNFGQAEKDLLLAPCTYDSIIGSYVFSTSDATKGALTLNIEVKSNHLVMHFGEIQSSIWQNYSNENATTNFNSLVDSLFADLMSTDTASTYYLTGNSCKFYRSWNMIYVFGSNAGELIESYKEALLSNSDIKYSAYQNQYINTETGTAISFDEFLTGNLPYAYITFTFNVAFNDYVKFSEIESRFADFTYLNLFPSIPNTIGENNKACVFGYAHETGASLYLIEEAYNAYEEAVKNDTNFNEMYEHYYQRVDADGNRASVSFSSYNHQVSFSYDALYYQVIDDIKDVFENDSFEFANNFVLPQDTGKIFKDNGHWGESFTIEYAPGLFNKDAYITLLEANSFVESGVGYGSDVCYAKVVGNNSYYVSINNNNISYSIYSRSDSEIKSYADFVDYLTNQNFDVKKLDRFVKIAGMDDHYYPYNGWKNEFEVIIINSAVTLQNYGNALLEAGYEYDSEENSYVLDETSVQISLCYGFLKIKYEDNRIIYGSMAEVIEKAKAQYFEEWRLAYMELPNQTGDLYCFDYAYTNYFQFYFDEDNFDVDAYKAQLIEAGYEEIYNNYYEKGEAKVQIYSSSIYVSYSGTNS